MAQRPRTAHSFIEASDRSLAAAAHSVLQLGVSEPRTIASSKIVHFDALCPLLMRLAKTTLHSTHDLEGISSAADTAQPLP